jgi:hypothetical protein
MAIDARELARWLQDPWASDAGTDPVVFPSQADEQACRQQTRDLVSSYLWKLPPDEPQPSAVETTVETPWVDPSTGEDVGIPLVGAIDLVLAHQSGPLVVGFHASGGDSLDSAQGLCLLAAVENRKA